jgi:hypothetical protein
VQLGRYGLVFVCVLAFLRPVKAQEIAKTTGDEFSRRHTLSIFADFSPTSSHILLGESRNRILTGVGLSYGFRFKQWRNENLSYVGEVRPVFFESDPVSHTTEHIVVLSGPNAGSTSTVTGSQAVIRCVASTQSGTVVFPSLPPSSYSYTITETCGRRWTFAESMLPAGLKYAVRTRSALQPYAVIRAGYMFSTQPIPTEGAGSFNFVFGGGAGLEWYRTHARSWAIEARWEHFSNKNTATENPGTDSIVYRVAYNFGR